MATVLTPVLALLALLTATAWPQTAPIASGPDPLPPGIRVETLVSGLEVPIAVVWSSDGRLWHTEKNLGQVHVRSPQGALLEVIDLPVPEEAFVDLYGLALDPAFPQQPLLYVFYTDGNPLSNRVLRFRYEGGAAAEPVVLLDAPVPGECLEHNGGNLQFGPDGMLYVTLGDNCIDDLAQDLTTPQGKVLRIDPATGAAPPDNPFHDGHGPNDDRIWALGLRNPFDLAFDPLTGNLWVSENGPGCGDEVNRVVKGGNYGWPLNSPSYFECIEPGPPYLEPEWSWTPTIAPTGITVYTGALLPAWRGSLIMCAWKTGYLYRLELDASRTSVTSLQAIDVSPAACRLAAASGPDGAVYMTTRHGEIFRLSSIPVWMPLIWR